MDPSRRAEVARLLGEIRAEARLTGHLTGRPELSPRVLDALAKVPRHLFVPREQVAFAWRNGPLPIGHGQTISQPFIVALMTDLLEPEEEQVVLEVGTGSGYQAAVLAHLVREVYTVEIVPELARSAAHRLAELGYHNVHVRHGDGSRGWPEHAPYDGILVAAAAPRIPPALVEQLKVGGRMVLPIGRPWSRQVLTLVRKGQDGSLDVREVLDVAFVPLTGEGGRRP
ncbi:MAG: protein-L-isoaspartate O-methyltransferase [Porticoccaceae bacterium]|nr:MAG: protein-L-isoaspartate O-methyltransferase [Porticoccaceae bacterium]